MVTLKKDNRSVKVIYNTSCRIICEDAAHYLQEAFPNDISILRELNRLLIAA